MEFSVSIEPDSEGYTSIASIVTACWDLSLFCCEFMGQQWIYILWLAYGPFMVLIESPIFTRLMQELLTDDSYTGQLRVRVSAVVCRLSTFISALCTGFACCWCTGKGVRMTWSRSIKRRLLNIQQRWDMSSIKKSSHPADYHGLGAVSGVAVQPAPILDHLAVCTGIRLCRHHHRKYL